MAAPQFSESIMKVYVPKSLLVAGAISNELKALSVSSPSL